MITRSIFGAKFASCIALVMAAAGLWYFIVRAPAPRPVQPYCYNFGGPFHFDWRNIVGLSTDERVPGPVTKFFYESYAPSNYSHGVIDELPDGRRFWSAAFVGTDSAKADDLLRFYTSQTVDYFIEHHSDQILERMAKWNAKPEDFGMDARKLADLIAGRLARTSYPCPLVQVLMTDPSPGIALMKW